MVVVVASPCFLEDLETVLGHDATKQANGPEPEQGFDRRGLGGVMHTHHHTNAAAVRLASCSCAGRCASDGRWANRSGRACASGGNAAGQGDGSSVRARMSEVMFLCVYVCARAMRMRMRRS